MNEVLLWLGGPGAPFVLSILLAFLVCILFASLLYFRILKKGKKDYKLARRITFTLLPLIALHSICALITLITYKGTIEEIHLIIYSLGLPVLSAIAFIVIDIFARLIEKETIIEEE